MKLSPYFRFTRQDIKGIGSFLVLILILLAGPVMLRFLMSGGSVSLNYADIRQAGVNNSLSAGKSISLPAVSIRKQGSSIGHFDPNTASEQVWLSTGLAPYKVKMILNYLLKGGHFYRAQDIQKIYSLNAAECTLLIPSLDIAAQPGQRPGHSRFSRNRYSRYPGFFDKKPAFRGKINLNLATYEDFSSLGLLSSQNIRILMRYRERNGNFSDIRELKNTGLLDLPTYKRIKPYLRL